VASNPGSARIANRDCRAGSPPPVGRVAAAVAGVVLAALPRAGRAESPCAGDTKQLCADVRPGEGRVHACLAENRDKLSPACQERLSQDEARARALLKEFSDACMGDVDRFCGAVRPGTGRVIQCLERHREDLSDACQEHTERFDVAREKVRAVRDACRADARTYCADQLATAAPLVECLEDHRSEISAECRASGPALASQAAAVIDAVDRLSSQERIQETLEVLQGLNSVAFTRSQIAFQIDAFQGLGGLGNADRLTFNPQFVFGEHNDFALIVNVPVVAVYPYSPQVATATGLGDVLTAFAWAFYAHGQIRQYLAMGLQWDTGTEALLGAAWAVGPTYAIALGLVRWLSLTTEITWAQSFGNRGKYPSLEVLYLRPILVASLPALAFAALDTKLAWNFANGSFVPVMKASVGRFVDRERSLSVSAWYQASLTSAAVSQSFKFGVGVGLSYFFDW